MLTNSNRAEWLKFCADDESGQLEPEPHQLPCNESDPAPAAQAGGVTATGVQP